MEREEYSYEMVDGVKVAFQHAAGGTKNLVLLHGWGGEAGSMSPIFRHYMNRYNVYNIDFPGFGRSDNPKEPWSVGDYTQLTRAWLRKLGVGSCTIISHSFGGRVSIKLAAQNPDLIEKMILVDAAGLIKKRGPRYYAKVYSYKAAKKVMSSTVMTSMLDNMGFDINEYVKHRAGSADYRSLSDHMKATFVKVVNEDLRGYLKSIQCPVLLIYGEHDQETPVSFGQIMEREIPDAGLVVMKGCGHFSYLDDFRRFVTITDSFI